MEIDITKKYDKYIDILPFVTDEDRKLLVEISANSIQPVYEMELGTFFACCNGDFTRVIKDINNPSTAEVLWCEHFAEFLKTFSSIITKLTIPQTSDQKRASESCLPIEWQEGMLVFVRRYFGLKSFGEAEKVILADYILAKKDDYNETMFNRALHRIQTSKLKK